MKKLLETKIKKAKENIEFWSIAEKEYSPYKQYVKEYEQELKELKLLYASVMYGVHPYITRKK